MDQEHTKRTLGQFYTTNYAYILQNLPGVLIIPTSELKDFKTNLSKILVKSLLEECLSSVQFVFIFQDEPYVAGISKEGRNSLVTNISTAMYYCLSPVKNSAKKGDLSTSFVYKSIPCLCLSLCGPELQTKDILYWEI